MSLVAKFKAMSKTQLCAFITAILVSIISCIDVIRYLVNGELISILTMLFVYFLFVFCTWGAFFSKCPTMNALVCGGNAILIGFTNFFPTIKNVFPIILVAVSGIGLIVGTVFAVREKMLPQKRIAAFLAVLALVPGIYCCIWGGMTASANARQDVQIETWQVPDKFDETECAEKGNLEKVSYQTKAYATDNRAVTKAVYVYTPYGYDATKQYDILYLMHGTGDDEAYWLVDNSWNKTMLDNMVYYKVIKPTIVVTPTFYVEDDCADDLDQLTYSFKDELRNDIMPLIEAKYSTYATAVTPEGFIASRDHRAFAGLSRGAVTTMHSVLCNSLDYFSMFGTFSGSRTTAEYYQQTAMSEANRNYSINYWYVTSGAFDFALLGQVENYKAILSVDSRLQKGVNTSMKVAPMRYHSQGNWHIALYNFMQTVLPY